MVKYINREFKTALNKLKFPDSWFWARYTINPYSGCEHACVYCDARSNRYYLQEIQDFENEVIIKTDIDKKLDLRIKRARTLLPDVVAMGGVNDSYQQIEKKAENTMKILKVFFKYKFPVCISTKSNLIIRDLELFEKIATNTWCAIGFSITTMDEELARFLEPFSSTPEERLEALKIIKKKAPNVQVGINFMPIIPFLCDTNKNLDKVIRKSSEAGAEFVLFSGLTLRDSQKDFFIKKLKKSNYKDAVQPLLDLYNGKKENWQEYYMRLNKKLLNLCKKYNLQVRMKRWIPKDYRKWNYKISELLLNKEYKDSLEGKSDSSMKWAGLNLNNLEESILDVYKRGEMPKLRNFNSKIIKFITPYLNRSKDLNLKKGLDKFL
ncbi:MAG: radical SAM protein [Promethearchaeota archaeon]|nr:MAG: radical SAM protein [Candidatus Lokiarchaeota archaeon]